MFCGRHASLGRHFGPLGLECYRTQSIRRRFAFHCNQTCILSASRMERGVSLVKHPETPFCPALHQGNRSTFPWLRRTVAKKIVDWGPKVRKVKKIEEVASALKRERWDFCPISWYQSTFG